MENYRIRSNFCSYYISSIQKPLWVHLRKLMGCKDPPIDDNNIEYKSK